MVFIPVKNGLYAVYQNSEFLRYEPRLTAAEKISIRQSLEIKKASGNKGAINNV